MINRETGTLIAYNKISNSVLLHLQVALVIEPILGVAVPNMDEGRGGKGGGVQTTR